MTFTTLDRRKPRILMFAPCFVPYEASENLATAKLALAFLNSGWTVDVISKRDEGFNYAAEWHPPWVPLQGITREVRYDHGGHFVRALDSIHHVLAMQHPIAGMRWAGRAFRLGERLNAQLRYDAILSRSPEDVGHLPAMILARKTGVPWLANWNDPPSGFWPAPYGHRIEGIGGLFMKRYVRHALRHASVNTFPCERLRRHVSRVTGCPESARSAVIPHIGLPDMPMVPLPRTGAFRLCHAGNLSKERRPEVFFDGLSRFIRTHNASETVRLEILGVVDSGLERLISMYGLDGIVRIANPLPYGTTLDRLVSFEVLVVVEAPCDVGIFLPSKVPDYAQTGRPILAVSPSDGTLADIINQHGGGILANNRSPESVEQALATLYKSWKAGRLGEEFGSSSKLRGLYDPKTVVLQYDGILNSLLARPRLKPSDSAACRS